jgi:N-acetylglucosaminyldiphosphoundecaprenol N-acetyl-beta-D-mannosaminyltransferase
MVLASRLLKGTVRERVTGSDLFAGVSEKLNAGAGARVFFLGARDETLVKIRQRMAVDYPNIVVAGTLAPPYRSRFSPAETAAMLEAIERADADVLWVGMTSPKQDLWIYQNRDRLNVRFAAGIGAGFDFYAGDVKRPRPVFRRLGLEWLPRLLNEPVRLWRRTFVSAPIFLWHVCRALMGSRRSLD